MGAIERETQDLAETLRGFGYRVWDAVVGSYIWVRAGRSKACLKVRTRSTGGTEVVMVLDGTTMTGSVADTLAAILETGMRE